MTRKRSLSLIMLFAVFGLAGLAIYLGISLQNQTTNPTDTSALIPNECQNLTSDDIDTGETPTTQYCPGSGGVIKLTGFSGELVFYCSSTGDCEGIVKLFVNGIDKKATMGSLTQKAELSGVNVVSGNTIEVKLQDTDYNKTNATSEWATGWLAADSGHICKGYGTVDSGSTSLVALVDKVESDGYTIFDVQCWADTPGIDDANFDFNDFGVVIAYEAEATPTPSYTLTPTVTRTSIPTATRTVTPTATRTTTPSGTVEPTLPPKPTLPPTAIIDDKTDTFIFGAALILMGLFLYKYVRENAVIEE